MKSICFVVDSLTGGGAERVAAVLANELVALGYETTVISKSHRYPFYPLDSRVELSYPKTKMTYGSGIQRVVEWLILHLEIFFIFKKNRPDLIIPFSTSTNGSIIIICRLLGIPVIACEHNNYKVNLNSIPVHFIKRRIYPLASWLTVLTSRDLEQYYGRFLKNVSVMPNPLPLIPLNRSEPLERLKTILAVGDLTRWKQKGFDNLLQIYKAIFEEHPEWSLKIAGGGDPEYLLELIRQMKLESRVELLGVVKDIQKLMVESSVFVLTSRYEGLPMVLIEGMSQGMACVSFDCFTGPGEIISDGLDGILVEDQNNEAFSAVLSDLLDDPIRISELGKRAIEKSEKYLPETILPQWESLIDRVLQ